MPPKGPEPLRGLQQWNLPFHFRFTKSLRWGSRTPGQGAPWPLPPRPRRIVTLAVMRPIGTATRGTTNPNRLRRMDRWIAAIHGPALRRAVTPVAVDLGYGAAPWTAVELLQRLRTAEPRTAVVGIEIDPERVAAAKPYEREGLTFLHGGFEIPLPERPSLIRAANVLRQYDEGEVAAVWQRLCARLAPGGLLVEGTCDEIGQPARMGGTRPRGPAHGHVRDPARLVGPPLRPRGTPPQGADPPQCAGRTGPRVPAGLRPGVGRGGPVRLARRAAALDRGGDGTVGRLAVDGRGTAVASGRSHGEVDRSAAQPVAQFVRNSPGGPKSGEAGGNTDGASFVLTVGSDSRGVGRSV